MSLQIEKNEIYVGRDSAGPKTTGWWLEHWKKKVYILQLKGDRRLSKKRTH